MSRISSFVLASFFTFTCASITAYGQTSVTGTAAPSLKSLSLESVVPIGNVDSTIAPNIPASLLSALTGGTMELRQQLNYNAAAKTLMVTGISEAPGSPLPTPSAATGVTALWTYTVNVDRVEMTAKPGNAVVFLGSVASGSSSTPFGDISGALATISAEYLAPAGTSSSITFAGISTSIAGLASLFSSQGLGTMVLGSSPSGGVPVAVAGPKNFISGTPQFQLDGTHSTDPSGGTVTYHWTFVPFFGTTANLVGADTASPTVTVPSYSDAAGDYTFQLMVSNSAGLSATDTVTVTYSPGHTDNP